MPFFEQISDTLANSLSMSSTECDEEVTGVVNFLIALANKFGINNDAYFASNDLKADIKATFTVPLIPLLIKDVSHPKTAADFHDGKIAQRFASQNFDDIFLLANGRYDHEVYGMSVEDTGRKSDAHEHAWVQQNLSKRTGLTLNKSISTRPTQRSIPNSYKTVQSSRLTSQKAKNINKKNKKLGDPKAQYEYNLLKLPLILCTVSL